MRVGMLLVVVGIVGACGGDDRNCHPDTQMQSTGDTFVPDPAVRLCPEPGDGDPYWEQGVPGDCSKCLRWVGASVTSCTLFPVCRWADMGFSGLRQHIECNYVNFCEG
jgi:hypothetical protein